MSKRPRSDDETPAGPITSREKILAIWREELDGIVSVDTFEGSFAYAAQTAPTPPSDVGDAAVRRAVEQTLLKPEATPDEVDVFVSAAVAERFFGVCVNGCHVKSVHAAVIDTDVKTVAVVGFPLGAGVSRIKAEEAQQAVADGADEIDMVINIGLLRQKEYQRVLEDISAVVKAVGRQPLKVILESSMLSQRELIVACGLCRLAGASFVKTSTGFLGGGATVEAVATMNACVGGVMGIKASGGVRTPEQARAMIAAGATRIGTSSGQKLLDSTPPATLRTESSVY